MENYLKRCEDCTECVKDGKIYKCHEMWDKPITEIEFCPFDIDSTEVEEILDKTKNVKVDVGKPKKERKLTKPREIKVSDRKREVFNMVWELLKDYYGENAKIYKDNKLIYVKNDEKTIKIDFVDSKTVKFD